MKKLLTLILIFSSSVMFAKEYSSSTYVRVTHSEPIYEYRSYKKPHYKEDYRYKNDARSYRSSNNEIGLDTIVGATIGVAIGNQIGKGNGKDVARVVGGLLGAAVANNSRVENNNYEASYASYDNYGYDNGYEAEYVRGGDDYYENSRHGGYGKEKVLVGYKNYFRYDHERHFKISSHPLREVRITKTINY